MRNPGRWIFVILALIGVAAIVYYHWFRQAPAPQPQPPAPPVETQPTPEAPPAPKIQYPVEEQPREKPLPTLSQSDVAVKEALSSLFGQKALLQYFYLDDIIRHIVATVDNLPREKVSQRLMPVKPVAGKFLVAGKEDNFLVDPANFSRYAPYVHLAETVSVKRVVEVYVHFYPLFQQAYQDLGYPNGYFNDRLIQVIDHLLAAPEVKEPFRLVQPKVFYEFADPQLEALSAGQKIMVRMGPENAAKIKAKLKEYRRELAREAPKP